MPDVRQLSPAEAKAILEKLELTVVPGLSEGPCPTDKERGTVVGQRPPPGTPVRAGERVGFHAC